ncbi:MAG: hypothetical protein REI96_06295 [Flavobacterium nitrogenifigens]|uniref:hypothetical protein n=1 Tax=Flavobacterium nitrogenifigens TaxID=1617283 RepID=UPI00280997C8|nr:hypothetical protein [Flavobacterium nitrogenifigens]MDQ8012037.1 hypothetical protein [Flavobacterium nitrogenifigens]
MLKIRSIKPIGFLLVAATCLTACKSSKPITLTEKYIETVTETVHDTVFEVGADSSSYKALLECRNGKVVPKEVKNASPGKKLKAPKVTIRDNVLTVDCEAEAQKLFAQWKSKQITKTTLKPTPIYIERELTFLEKFFMVLGKISLLLIAIGLTIWIIKKKIAAYRIKN